MLQLPAACNLPVPFIELTLAGEDMRKGGVFDKFGPDGIVLQKDAGYPFSLIRFYAMPQQGTYRHCQQHYYKEVLYPRTGGEEHYKQDRHHQQYRAEVRLKEDEYHCQKRQRERSDKSAEMAIVSSEPQVPCKGEYVRDFAEFRRLNLQIKSGGPRQQPDPPPCIAGRYSCYERQVYNLIDEQNSEYDQYSGVYPVTCRTQPAVVNNVNHDKSQQARGGVDELFLPCPGKSRRLSASGVAGCVNGNNPDPYEQKHGGQHYQAN